MKKRNLNMQPIRDILSGYDLQEKKYISREFQDFGYRLAQELNDLEHKALYIKLAKELPRSILEKAKNFVKDAHSVKKPGKLFMWRLTQLKKERGIKE